MLILLWHLCVTPDECQSSPCLHGGTCHDGIAAYNCVCPHGYHGDTCHLPGES